MKTLGKNNGEHGESLISNTDWLYRGEKNLTITHMSRNCSTSLNFDLDLKKKINK